MPPSDESIDDIHFSLKRGSVANKPDIETGKNRGLRRFLQLRIAEEV
jgi:hypothetical protein